MARARRAPQFEKVYGETECEGWMVVSEEHAPGSEKAQHNQELMRELQYFHGRMNRHVAEEQLRKSDRRDGTFLVRESDAMAARLDPVYVISVIYNDKAHHIDLETRPNGKYAIANLRGAKEFKTLDKLVKHYRSKAMDLDGGGSTKLHYFIENSA